MERPIFQRDPYDFQNDCINYAKERFDSLGPQNIRVFVGFLMRVCDQLCDENEMITARVAELERRLPNSRPAVVVQGPPIVGRVPSVVPPPPPPPKEVASGAKR